MKKEFKQFIVRNNIDFIINDFPTIHYAYKHNLRFELGDKLKNGSKKRIKQAFKRALKIADTCFKNDNKIYIVSYEWNGDDEDFLARTPYYLYEKLKVKKPKKETLLSLMHFHDEQPEFKKGTLGIWLFQKKKIKFKKLFKAIANTDMGFNPTIHQVTFFFGAKSGKLFWMYDDRGCLVMAQETKKLKEEFNTYKDWLCKGYKLSDKTI